MKKNELIFGSFHSPVLKEAKTGTVVSLEQPLYLVK